MRSFTFTLCKRVFRDAIWHSDLGVTAVVTEAVLFHLELLKPHTAAKLIKAT